MDAFGRRTGKFTIVMDGSGRLDGWVKAVRGGLSLTIV